MYFIDFGTGAALAIHGPDGPISKGDLKLPRVKGGRTPAMELPMAVEALFQGGEFGPPGDVCFESPTIGSSGCEPGQMEELLNAFLDRKLFTITARAIKNYRRDNGLIWPKGGRYARTLSEAIELMRLYPQEAVHLEDAAIGYQICVDSPWRMYNWTGPSFALERKHTSVRPMDKHLYRNQMALDFWSMAPKHEDLPKNIAETLSGGCFNGYSGEITMPIIMSTDEPFVDEGPKEERRRRWEKVVGLYDRGYPCFYRRASVTWMQAVALSQTGKMAFNGSTRGPDKEPLVDGAGKPLPDEDKPFICQSVKKDERKEAWRETQRQMRHFFHLMMDHQGR